MFLQVVVIMALCLGFGFMVGFDWGVTHQIKQELASEVRLYGQK